MQELLHNIKQCSICKDHLLLGPRPVVSAHPNSKIVIIGQAPGTKVHASGIPWDDASGKQLRKWLDVSVEDFYDDTKFAIIPMGFCYPGTGKSGDLPPRKECAELWHAELLGHLNDVGLTLLIGEYVQSYMLQKRRRKNLTETVRDWRQYTPLQIPLPHPSPRNNRWLKRNDWFEADVLPYLRRRVKKLLR